jgi:hypothetical protein
MPDINWVAVNAVSTVVRTVYEIFRTIPSKDRTPPPELAVLPPDPPSSDLQLQPERYQVGLGQRHKFLRENILKLNPREMADFYGFERVAYLEDCEAGLDEFPTAAMQRLVQVFFVSPKYLQEGEEYASFFQFFQFWSDRQICRRFLEEEFQPMFLCHPDFQQDGLAYLVFLKCDQGYWRIAKTLDYRSFYSYGGSGIFNLIYSMIKLKIPYSATQFRNVKQDDWEKLLFNRWYKKRRELLFGSSTNLEAMKFFEHWYNEAYEEMSKYPKIYD